MNSRILHAVTVALVLALIAPALAAAASPRVATVNGVAIPKSYVEIIVKAQTQQGTPDNDQLRSAITERLIEMQILAQEAKKKKLDRDPELKAQLDVQRMQALANAYVQDFLDKHPVSDAAAKAEYDKLRAKSGETDYKARHILLDTESEARDVIAKLKSGEKFEELAKLSKDNGTKDKGGELDWSTPDSFVKPFSDALVKLQKGQYTETPVQTKFGWHVIQLDDTRPAQYPAFDEVKDQLKQNMQQPALVDAVKALREKAKVVMH